VSYPLFLLFLFNISFMHVIKACRGNSSRTLLILNIDTRWRCMVNFTPRPSYCRHSFKIKHVTPCGNLFEKLILPQVIKDISHI
jgi:hypothetical protein